jgi:hypothetical protein
VTAIPKAPMTLAARPGARFAPMVKASAPTPRPLARGEGRARSLVLAYRPGWQSIEDLRTIARHVGDIDPSIATFIVQSTTRSQLTRRHAAEQPSLVVSPGSMPTFRPLRGKVYQGSTMAKLDELRRLAAGGVPVPKTAIVTPDLRLDPAEWGDFVIVKPTDLATSSHGYGIQLMRTHRVRYVASADYPRDHPGRLAPMMVQQYIDAGERPGIYRVLTLFGEALYSYFIGNADGGSVDLSVDDERLEQAVVATQAYRNATRVFAGDPDVLALARRAHDALPEIPLKGCDVIRDAGGGLWVLEVNSGGNTWHFSSAHFDALRRSLGLDWVGQMHRQFDAMRTAARVLAERTNAEAE